MDKSYSEFLAFRRALLLSRLLAIVKEMTNLIKLEQQLLDGSEEVHPFDLEAEVIDIMKSEKKTWTIRKLARAVFERNLHLGMDHPSLMEQLSSILQGEGFKTVEPGQWELAESPES